MQNAADIAAQRRDEEDVRLVTGAADVLAGIASLIALITLGAVLGAAGPFAGALVAAAATALAIPLVKQRNFAFSAIVLTLCAAFGVLVATAMLEFVAGFVVAGFMVWFWKTFRVPIAGALVVAAPVATILGMRNLFQTTWGEAVHGKAFSPASSCSASPWLPICPTRNAPPAARASASGSISAQRR